MTNQIISWQEFKERKERARKKLLRAAASRVEFGFSSHVDLDLDLLPVLNSWDDIPFSFTFQSCSGTPKEHRREEYRHFNGLKENPNAYLAAHSYIAHPHFPMFKRFLEEYLIGKADFHKSEIHGLEGYEGIYLHLIDINVPEDVKTSGDLQYLDRFWKEFQSRLDQFVMENKASREWL